MKRLISTLLVVGLFGSLAGCQKSGLPQPSFPLTEDVVLAAQEQTGLPGVITETKSYGEGHMIYTLRHPTETYSSGENKLVTAFVSSAITEGERFMQMYFSAPNVTEKPEFKWEDWKQQLEFSALLYGGFADAEEVYRILSSMDVAEAKVQTSSAAFPGTEIYEWYVQLPGAYCRVRYDVSASSWSSSSYTGKVIKAWRNELHVTFYETKTLYEKRQKNYMEWSEKEEERKAAIKEARSEALKETAPWLVD